MPNFKVTITCKGSPIIEFVFDKVEGNDKQQIKEWAMKQPLPHHKIKSIEIEEE